MSIDTRHFIVFVAALGITVAPARVDGASHLLESRPTSVPITVDGNPSDWHDAASIYLEDSLHSVSISHDRDNLYVMYRFSDQWLAHQLLMRGAVLWLNGDGKTKNKGEPYGVRYAGSSQIEEYFETLDERDKDRPDVAVNSAARPYGPLPGSLAGMPPTPDELTVIRAGLKESVPRGAIDLPAAGATVVDDSFCYELRIPIADIGGKVSSTPASRKRQVAIGLQPGGLTEAEREFIQSQMRAPRGDMMPGRGGGMGGGGGRPPGGMGGGGAGGGHGGMRGEGREEWRQRLEPEITWLEITLLPVASRDSS